jgi:hypothetical protein
MYFLYLVYLFKKLFVWPDAFSEIPVILRPAQHGGAGSHLK